MKTRVRIAFALLAIMAATPALAADIRLSPVNLSMSIPAGESGSATVVASVNNPPPTNYLVSLQFQSVGGTMPAPWLETRPSPLTNLALPARLSFVVRVPSSAAAGAYTAFLQPMVLSSSIPLAPSRSPLQVLIFVTRKCAAPPAVLVSAQPLEFKAPNGRLEDVSVNGSITLPAGCTLAGAWYTVDDEYDMLDERKDIATAADGSFSFTTAVQVSRHGDDKDGRSYKLTVHASDEAGTGESAPVVVVVQHDQRKEK